MTAALASDESIYNGVADWFETNGKLVSKEPTKEQVVRTIKETNSNWYHNSCGKY
ncbi:hypothetical protein [Spiroplasma poulsonii]|uniref:hypothetical protein n=1 Tax=Spiroplasma poulsonii TaxID=2138 RepID=UPI001F4C8116|nr:hypothetical protein [Spiroplasma poulsonii]UNF62767.1 hypothetical protein MNU24_08645 [Spiroplasma poulsonii]